MKVHDLLVALTQCDRAHEVTVKNGKIAVDGKLLKVAATDAEEEDADEGKDKDEDEGDA